MEDTKKLMTEELNQMKSLMRFKAGMTKTELKSKLMDQLAEEAADARIVDDVKEGDEKEVEVDVEVKEEDEKKVEVDVEVKEEDEKEVEVDVEVKEDMFEQPEIKSGGYKMAQGFVDSEIPSFDMKAYFKRLTKNPEYINKIYKQLSKGTYEGQPALDVMKSSYKEYSGKDLPIKLKKLDIAPEVTDNAPVLDQPTEKGYTNMAQGFVNESISQKERIRVNKQARLNKKLGST